jgi:chloramphenicol 3-O-phosphotransferase
MSCQTKTEQSGVMFTADPMSGARDRAVIDACIGVGEALVSGAIEPDHYLVDVVSKRVLQRSIGKKVFVVVRLFVVCVDDSVAGLMVKALSMRCDADGGLITVEEKEAHATEGFIAELTVVLLLSLHYHL